jgi:predicted Zn-ribbon and HTH transcriptional regulator
MKKHKCQKCGHEWRPRIDKLPVQCPACKRLKWNQPKEKS